MKRFVAALAVISATVFGGLAVAAPAQADPGQEHYAILINDGPVRDHVFYIEHMEQIIGCAKCVYLLKYLQPEENPHWQGGVMEGLDLLSQASVAGDPRAAAGLRARALESFTTAARGLGDAALVPGQAMAYDPQTRRTFAIDAPWLEAAQADIAAGTAALQRSFCDPVPLPWVDLATKKFDEAFSELSTKKAI